MTAEEAAIWELEDEHTDERHLSVRKVLTTELAAVTNAACGAEADGDPGLWEEVHPLDKSDLEDIDPSQWCEECLRAALQQLHDELEKNDATDGSPSSP